MAALTYQDQHLGWQQRIFKEHRAAYQTIHSSPAATKKKAHRKTPKASSNRARLWAEPVVYEEMRGKYARFPKFSPPKVCGVLETPGASKIVFARPQSTGGCVRRGSCGQRRPHTQDPRLFVRPRTQSSNRGAESRLIDAYFDQPHLRQTRKHKTKDEDNLIAEQTELLEQLTEQCAEELDERNHAQHTSECAADLESVVELAAEQAGEQAAEQAPGTEIEQNIQGAGQFMKTASVWSSKGKGAASTQEDELSQASKSTRSTHRRYIHHLETLLRTERIKRLTLENELAKISQKLCL